MRRLGFLLALTAPGAVQAQEVGELVRFVSCPIYRDTDAGRKSGCWLADDLESGERFDVSESPYKPDWGLAVLVEGKVAAEEPENCGSKVLNPVRSSRLDIPCPRHLLPAESYPGRRFVLPPRNILPLFAEREVPPGPYGPRKFYTFFEFDNDFIVYQYDDYLLDQAVAWIRAAKPRKLVVTGFAATTPEDVSGRLLAERPEVAQERANAIAVTLRRMLPDLPVEVKWEVGSKPIDTPDADGIPGQSQRRTEIDVLF
ncbi:MAG: hypothetical protein ACK5NN_05540 [Sphingomonadaceae bacterium]